MRCRIHGAKVRLASKISDIFHRRRKAAHIKQKSMPAISLLLLFSALLGWNLLGIRATGSRYYGPLWSLCVLTVAIYLFALFGMLQPVTLALVGAGIAYLIYLVVSKQLATVRDYRPFLIAAPLFFLLAWLHSRGMAITC